MRRQVNFIKAALSRTGRRFKNQSVPAYGDRIALGQSEDSGVSRTGECRVVLTALEANNDRWTS